MGSGKGAGRRGHDAGPLEDRSGLAVTAEREIGASQPVECRDILGVGRDAFFECGDRCLDPGDNCAIEARPLPTGEGLAGQPRTADPRIDAGRRRWDCNGQCNCRQPAPTLAGSGPIACGDLLAPGQLGVGCQQPAGNLGARRLACRCIEGTAGQIALELGHLRAIDFGVVGGAGAKLTGAPQQRA